ncbi:hypothetical protein B0A50_04038 [Salinomyces thailandicus]|uniref:Uncharacterized protein n=1 Tax=Salinomyces thailandicus TaxID=706561 RepID=A0A4U0U0J6_9PEZI|nr:hypothetical protein B0A50_04038 [Salinomyces thailandica]
MPQALTPLARQLRSVLAHLRPAQCLPVHTGRSADRSPSKTSVRAEGSGKSGVQRAYYASTRCFGAAASASAAAVADARAAEEAMESELGDTPRTGGPFSRRTMKKNTRRDYLTEALQASGAQDWRPKRRSGKKDISHWSVKSRHGRRKMQVNAGRHAGDRSRLLAYDEDPRLDLITAKLIRRNIEAAKTNQAEKAGPLMLARRQILYLQSKGYSVSDALSWASIVSEHDTYTAAKSLALRNGNFHGQPVPIFVLNYLLRKAHLNARAIRILLFQSQAYLEHRSTPNTSDPVDETTVVILFVRLLRHARQKWPSAINEIVEIFLGSISQQYEQKGPTSVSTLTHLLNKAMHLVAIPTSVEPFKEAYYQEMAIIRILRFMAGHQPPLQMNREGYRAVIRVQLAQKKTPSEQQWAELKALSWPPWKQERTAMDALITPRDHGLTRAGDTLRRMREAGYAPGPWEEAALIFAGWDIDRTPTIQWRAAINTGVARFQDGSATWAARITATRTAQEAWAAYLAFEDSGLEPDEDVHLAIVQKLHQEEKRQHRSVSAPEAPSAMDTPQERILPGEKAEVEPLPPSTHLYTYVRRPVPSVEDFFRQLVGKGVYPQGHFLGYIVGNASSLQLGFEYLRTGSRCQLDIERVLDLDPDFDFSTVSLSVLSGLIELLCRYSNVPLTKLRRDWYFGSRPLARLAPAPPVLDKHHLNVQHPLVFALELLKLSRSTHVPLWSAVLHALSQKATIQSMSFLTLPQDREPDYGDLTYDYQSARGTISASTLVGHVLSMLQELHIDLDSFGFHALCTADEHMVYFCWKALKRNVSDNENEDIQHSRMDGQQTISHEAHAVLSSTDDVARLKSEFHTLVGDGGNEVTGTGRSFSDLALPRLLTVPSAAVLHAYIRALGWRGDHRGLQDLLGWMVEHRSELAEQRTRDRNAMRLMRRAIIALRVFLERSWLNRGADGSIDAVVETELDGPQAHDPRAESLRGLERPASAEEVREAARLVDEVEEWNGWPTDDEVEKYSRDPRFREIRSLYDTL